jgi:TRAP-type C4-dicarboxylate transport system permease large subunit
MSIAVTTVILFVVFGVLLFLGVPISVSIIASSIVTAMSTLSWDQITFITMQKMNSGVESFSLLAVPLFILAGNIMNNGGIAKRLINFAQIFVGKIPGNLAQANILANMLFGALSGSSVAAASAIGGCMSPIEKEQKYDPAYATPAPSVAVNIPDTIPPITNTNTASKRIITSITSNNIFRLLPVSLSLIIVSDIWSLVKKAYAAPIKAVHISEYLTSSSVNAAGLPSTYLVNTCHNTNEVINTSRTTLAADNILFITFLTLTSILIIVTLLSLSHLFCQVKLQHLYTYFYTR